MNRQEFMKILKAELNKLPEEDVKDATEYYEEYFDEAGVENEAAVLGELGNPVKVANRIKADYAVKRLEVQGKDGGKKGLSAAWWVILGILAAPVAFPLALAGAILVFALFVTIWAVAFALLVAVVALLGSGIFVILIGIMTLGTNLALAILTIGVGLIITGLMVLIGVAVLAGTKAVMKALMKWVNGRRNRSAMKGGE